MISLHQLTSRVALAAALAAAMAPTAVYAGEQTKAEAAIAEARGKIDAGDKDHTIFALVDGTTAVALASAQDLLSHHHKGEAIVAAHHASDLADQAIVSANNHKTEAEHARRDELRNSAADAQQSAADANNRADNAQRATTMANVRADSAERSSAAANAQADALRNAPPPVAPPSTTTVAVTQHEVEPVAPTHQIRHRVIHKRHHRAPVKSTTTTITTTHP